MKKQLFLFTFFSAFALTSAAQCPAGQVEVTIDVITDDWGYECFWDITPAGNGCGNGALFTFGNSAEVNCLSGGSQVANAGGYPDNSTTTEMIGCLTLGTCFDINYVDDYGDGGATFVLKFNNVYMQTFASGDTTITATHSFCVTVPPAFDASVEAEGFKYTLIPKSQAGNIIQAADFMSAGTSAITGAEMQVTVYQGVTSVYSQTSAPQIIPSLTTVSPSVPAYAATTPGNYSVTYSVQMIEIDEVPTNNTASYVVDVSDSTYALDDNIADLFSGIGSDELAYFGNLFEITAATNATSLSAYLGNGSNNGNPSIVDSVFSLHLFATDSTGIPTTIIGTATGTIQNVSEKWYTVQFTNPIPLAVGKYMVALEELNYLQELGVSANFNPLTSYVYSETLLPWSPIEDLGFPATPMLRVNLASSGLSVAKTKMTSLELYPNPVATELILSSTQAGSKLQIFNQLGQMVFSGETKTGNTSVDVRELPSGIYTVKTVQDKQVGMAKFVKQ